MVENELIGALFLDLTWNVPSNLNTEPWHQLSHFHRKSTERQHVISMNNTPEEEKKNMWNWHENQNPSTKRRLSHRKKGKRRIYAKNTKLAPAHTHTQAYEIYYLLQQLYIRSYDNLLILHFRQSIKTMKITVIFYLNHFFWNIRCLLSPLLCVLLPENSFIQCAIKI